MMKKTKIIVLLLTLILALNVATPAFAEEEGPITCDGPLDFACQIQNFLLNTSIDGINGTLEEFKLFVVKPKDIIENPTIEKYYDQAYDFCFTLITILFLYKLVELLAVGDPEARGNLRNGLSRLLFTVVFAYSFPKLFQWLLTFNNWYVKALLSEGASFEVLKLEESDIETAINTSMSLVLLSVLSFILLILMIICVFQLAIRSAELTFMFAISPIAIASNLSDNFNMLPTLWRNLISTIFTQAVQITLLVFMANLFANANIWEPHTIFLAVGYLFLVVKAPSMLKEYLYSTGSGKMIGGIGVNTVATATREAIRRIK